MAGEPEIAADVFQLEEGLDTGPVHARLTRAVAPDETAGQILADLADILFVDGADLTDDTDLIDLGLDSMRVLGLVMRWGETGIALEFPHLAEHVTLAGWWATVQQLQQRAGQR